MFRCIIDKTLKRTSVMMNWKRNVFKKPELSPELLAKMRVYTKVLAKSGVVENHVLARRLLKNNLYIFDSPLENIRKVFAVCRKWNVDMKTLPEDPTLLSLSVESVENTIMILDEMGVKEIHAALVSRYYHWPFYNQGTTRISLFKAFVGIPKSVNMTHKIIECLGPFSPDVPPLETLSENLTVPEFREQCWRWYLNWRLNLSETHNKILDLMKPKSAWVRRRSFRVMKQQIDLLCDEIGVTHEQLLRRGCLTKGSADELRKIISMVRTFAGIEIKKLIRVKPTLSRMQFDNVVKIQRLLKKNSFTNKMMRQFPEILLLPFEKVKKSIDMINDTPELRILKNNSKILLLVKDMTSVQIRLAYLRYHNMHHVTINGLTMNRKRFEAAQRTGRDDSNALEIGMSFEKILDLDAEEIVRRIKKHQFWNKVKILSMHESVEFLLRNFSPKDITDNIQLILYPKDKIAETLNKISEAKDDSKEKKFSDKQTLAYCLYLIEQNYHFTGDGVWGEPPKQQKYLLTADMDSELSDSEDTQDVVDNEATTCDTRHFGQLEIRRRNRRKKNEKSINS